MKKNYVFNPLMDCIAGMFGGERAEVAEIEGYKVVRGTREQIESEGLTYDPSPAIYKDRLGTSKGIIVFPENFSDEDNFVLYHEIGHVERPASSWRLMRKESAADDYSFERLGIANNRKEKRRVIKNLFKQSLKVYGIIPGSVVVLLNLHRFIRLL